MATSCNVKSLATAEDESESIESVELTKSSRAWNGKSYEKYPEGKPCLTVMKMSFEANTTMPWHTHHMPSVAFIISGSLTVEDKNTGITRVFKAGEAFNESVYDVHRGYTTNEPVEVVVTYAGVEGQPLSVPFQP